MKTMQRIIAVALLLAGGNLFADIWTSINGDTIEADFVKEKGGIVHLKTPDGSIKKIKKSALSKADQEKIVRLSNPFAGKKAEAETATPHSSEAIQKMFGKKLKDARGKNVAVNEALGGKIIGIYFSAHWCGPCRAFTPDLVEFHKKVTKKGKPFEIVFVSSDRSSGDMYDYMEEMDMPWPALPFGDIHKGELSKKYGVRGIPALIIIDAEGNLITKNGRGDVSSQGAKAFETWANAE